MLPLVAGAIVVSRRWIADHDSVLGDPLGQVLLIPRIFLRIRCAERSDLVRAPVGTARSNMFRPFWFWSDEGAEMLKTRYAVCMVAASIGGAGSVVSVMGFVRHDVFWEGLGGN